METKIAEVQGYTVVYDSYDREFHLRDSGGDRVGSGKTQEEVEAQAEKLNKQQFAFPIPALRVSGPDIHPGRVTSINLGDESVRFAYDVKGSSHEKVRLYHSSVYEATPHNQDIAAEVASRRKQMEELLAQIRCLIAGLDQKLDREYFKLPA